MTASLRMDLFFKCLSYYSVWRTISDMGRYWYERSFYYPRFDISLKFMIVLKLLLLILGLNLLILKSWVIKEILNLEFDLLFCLEFT